VGEGRSAQLSWNALPRPFPPSALSPASNSAPSTSSVGGSRLPKDILRAAEQPRLVARTRRSFLGAGVACVAMDKAGAWVAPLVLAKGIGCCTGSFGNSGPKMLGLRLRLALTFRAGLAEEAPVALVGLLGSLVLVTRFALTGEMFIGDPGEGGAVAVSVLSVSAEERLVFFACWLRTFSSSSEEGYVDVRLGSAEAWVRIAVATMPNEGARLKDCFLPLPPPVMVL
jgi:hypothetical protein